MTPHEIVDGVWLLSHMTDSLELTCAVDQVPLLMKANPGAQFRFDSKRSGEPNDQYVAPSWCNL